MGRTNDIPPPGDSGDKHKAGDSKSVEGLIHQVDMREHPASSDKAGDRARATTSGDHVLSKWEKIAGSDFMASKAELMTLAPEVLQRMQQEVTSLIDYVQKTLPTMLAENQKLVDKDLAVPAAGRDKS